MSLPTVPPVPGGGSAVHRAASVGWWVRSSAPVCSWGAMPPGSSTCLGTTRPLSLVLLDPAGLASLEANTRESRGGGTCLRRCSCAAGPGWSPGLCPVGSFSLTVSELQLLSGSRARLAKPGAGHAGLSAALQLGSHMRIRAPLGAHRLGFPTSGTSMRSPIPPREQQWPQQCLPWQPQGRPCGPPFHSTGWPSLLKTSLLGWGGGV